MGLFDKKRKDEFDSPVEVIDLSREPDVAPAPAPVAATPARARPSRPEPDADYGIDRAIELMRTLPGDNVELVVRVVKLSLESAHVKVSSILEDAAAKLGRLEARVSTLRGEIAELQSEIAARTKEIEKHEADHKETSLVRDRMLLAEKLSSSGAPAPTAPAATRVAVTTPVPAAPAATPQTAVSGMSGGPTTAVPKK